MVSDHVKDVNEFKQEANAGRDPQVKSFASSTLPTLEEHLQQARAGADADHHGDEASRRATNERLKTDGRLETGDRRSPLP